MSPTLPRSRSTWPRARSPQNNREEPMDPFDFAARAVLVAGGTSGINLAIAEAFAERGAKLAVMSRNKERVEAAVKQLKAHGGKAAGAADARDAAAVAGVLAAVHNELGDIDILISGAAGNFPAAVLGMSPNAFKAVVDIDLLGTFNVVRSAHQYLKKPGAVIINISA